VSDRQVRRVRRNSRRTRRGLVGLLWSAPALLLVAVFFIAPVALMVVMSLFQWPLLGDPRFIGLDNYQRALTDPGFVQPVTFTVLYTVLIVPALFLVGLGLAHLVRGERRGTGLFRTLFFIPVVIGFASASYLWLWLADSRVGPLPALLRTLGLGEFRTPWASSATGALVVVCLMILWKVAGYTMLLFMMGLQAIPAEVMEAARVDGAGVWRTFGSITLPLLRRTIALVFVLTTAGSLLAFDQFYIMTRGGPANGTITVVYAIYRESFIRFQLGYGAALSVLLALVLIGISAVQLKIVGSEE